MQALLGHHAEAAAAFDRARTTLEKNGQRPLRAMADYDEALALLRSGRGRTDAPKRRAGRTELIEAAEAAFAALGMERLGSERPRITRRAGRRPPPGPGVASAASLPAGMTARELDILRLVARGNSDRQIGEELYLSPRTVNAHIRHMLAKTTLSNRTELSVWAVEQGLVER